jgi:hypothetical protein
MHHRPKSAGIVQTQHPPIGHQVGVVVHTGAARVIAEMQSTGHAQVPEQAALIQMHEQVFATTTDL